MDRNHIIQEIHRTAKANGGKVLGWRRFQTVAGIRYHDGCGRFWARWGDAVQEVEAAGAAVFAGKVDRESVDLR